MGLALIRLAVLTRVRVRRNRTRKGTAIPFHGGYVGVPSSEGVVVVAKEVEAFTFCVGLAWLAR